jgi:hypothetical protein
LKTGTSPYAPRHQQVSSPGGRHRDPDLVTATEEDELRRLRPAPVGAERRLAFQQIGEALELRRDGCRDLPAFRQLDVEDERGRPEANARALADEHPHGRVAFLALGSAPVAGPARWARPALIPALEQISLWSQEHLIQDEA